MNLRDLKYIIAVAEHCHFGRAAEQCFVSQPTLSGQVKKLEDELGVTIFERTKRSVELTPVGGEMVDYAKRIVEQADAMQQLARSHQDPLAGPLRLGAIPTLSPYLIPLILRPLKQEYPQMQLVLHEEITDRLLKRLHNYEIDAALIATPVDPAEFSSMALFDEPFWLALPRQHPLYFKLDITQQDLNELDLLLLSDGHCLAQQIKDVCQLSSRNQAKGHENLQASSLETLLQLVSAGYGSTLVPALATGGAWMTDSGIQAIELHLPNTFRRISLVYRHSFPRMQALQAFARLLSEKLPNTVRVIEQDYAA